MTPIEQLAAAIEANETNSLKASGYTLELHNVKTRIVPGRKYTKIDVGTSGRFMVENATGKVYGIKAYGVIHRGHYHGTIEELLAKFDQANSSFAKAVERIYLR